MLIYPLCLLLGPSFFSSLFLNQLYWHKFRHDKLYPFNMYSLWALTDVHTCEIKIQNVFTIFSDCAPVAVHASSAPGHRHPLKSLAYLFFPLSRSSYTCIHILCGLFVLVLHLAWCFREIHHVVACISSLLLVDGYPCMSTSSVSCFIHLSMDKFMLHPGIGYLVNCLKYLPQKVVVCSHGM